MVATNTAKTWDKQTLQALQKQYAAKTPKLANWQQQQLQQFVDAGFPNRHVEDWKYTNVSDIANNDFNLVAAANESVTVPSLGNVYCLVFVNGVFSAELSDNELESGLTVETLSNDLTDNKITALLEKTYPQQTRFSALNAALLTDALLIHVADHAIIQKPIHIIHLNNAQQPAMGHVRHIISVGEHAQATIFEEYRSGNDTLYFNNVVTQINLQAAATLNHYKLQAQSRASLHVANILADLQKDSALCTRHFMLGAKLSRDDLQIALQQPRSYCDLLGFYQTESGQHIDNHTRIDHLVENCESAQHYRGVMAEKSHAVFNGKVVVHENATGSVANQANKNLLLAKSAEVDTKPELEIYNDDVKCSHGATVGQLDAKALFYLRSRGIDMATAERMLTRGFANEILNALPDNIISQYIINCVRENLHVA